MGQSTLGAVQHGRDRIFISFLYFEPFLRSFEPHPLKNVNSFFGFLQFSRWACDHCQKNMQLKERISPSPLSMLIVKPNSSPCFRAPSHQCCQACAKNGPDLVSKSTLMREGAAKSSKISHI